LLLLKFRISKYPPCVWFEIEDSKSKGRISKLRHFIRQKRLFATKGYFSHGIGIVDIAMAVGILEII